MVRLPDGQTALVVRALARNGTASLCETWYLLTEGRLTIVLDYPVRGHMIGWPSTFDRSFVTTALPRSAGGGVDQVTVDSARRTRAAATSTGCRSSPSSSRPVGRTTAWKRAARRFVLDPVRSDVYDDEIEGLFHDAEEQFLRHNVQELAQLAARANDGQRAWLRHFLDSVPDGPEKRAVMENLR